MPEKFAAFQADLDFCQANTRRRYVIFVMLILMYDVFWRLILPNISKLVENVYA